MAVNHIKIFDDTVLKLSINQGLEVQRSTESLGAFTSGELAYTRDTGRLFVGDNSDKEANHIGLQETVGGSLAGNKYLGLIDSKPLTTFYNNGTPLSYETYTNKTGTQEGAGIFEFGLFTDKSKFKLHSKEGASEEWNGWDRTAIYNDKYGAYNGDFVYDIYQNAFILFDKSISNDPNNEAQPKVKMDGAIPASPETFIVDGKEISSDDGAALSIKRRSKLMNYVKPNDDAEINPIYGDGYVILRNVEPDNQTVRFKQREFQPNGLPTTVNNYTHNILEVFQVPTSAIEDDFSEDFFVADNLVYLNPKLANIETITGANDTICIPANISFSNNVSKDGRNVSIVMNWNMLKPRDIYLQNGGTYQLYLTPTAEKNDGHANYLCFNGELRPSDKIKAPFYIHLDGLESDQENPDYLILNLASCDQVTAPTLRVTGVSGSVLDMYSGDPYYTNYRSNYVYVGNMGFYYDGTMRIIDEFQTGYYTSAQLKIDKWEEQNTPINFLKTPVTIVQSTTEIDMFTDTSLINALSDAGINVNLDFGLVPYLYCAKKVVSSPSSRALPSITDPSQYPNGSNGSYFNSFSDENVKVWNDIISVLGNNHYQNMQQVSNLSMVPLIDRTQDSPLKKSVFRNAAFYVDESGTNVERVDVLEEDPYEDIMLFAWWEETDVGGSRNVIYYPHEDYEPRPDSLIEVTSKEISSVKFEGSDIELISGGYGVTPGMPNQPVMDSATERVRKLFAVTTTSALWDGTQRYVTFTAKDGQKYRYDFVTTGKVSYGYKHFTDLRPTKITTIDPSGAKSTITSGVDRIIQNGVITIDTIVAGNKTAGDYKYLILSEPTTDENGETDELTEVIDILPNVPYVTGFNEPISHSGVRFYNGTAVTSGTLNEELDEEDRVYIPEHARSIILEVAYNTTEDNTIAIMYANNFGDLATLFSGLPVVEYDESTPAPSSLSPTHTFELEEKKYVSSGGGMKLKLGKPISVALANRRFHDTTKSITENKGYRPSVLTPAANEKVLFNSCRTETRVIEVPLQKIPGTQDQRHFALRIANFHYCTATTKSSLAIRVLGYRA